MERSDIIKSLRETDAGRLEDLWRQADEVRRERRRRGAPARAGGDLQPLRPQVRLLRPAGRQRPAAAVPHDAPRKSSPAPRQAVEFGYGTVVLQAGEDYGIRADWMAAVVRGIKAGTPLAVTLSLGERGRDDLGLRRQAGADRYLLRFETSNRRCTTASTRRLPGRPSDRLAILRTLRELGYEIGSGVMIGIPGQTYDDLADDIETFAKLDLDMIGVGPFIPHPDTPLGQGRPRRGRSGRRAGAQHRSDDLQGGGPGAPGLPAGQHPQHHGPGHAEPRPGPRTGPAARGQRRHAQPTPPATARMYEIYPAKACIRETAEACHACIQRRILAIGRTVGTAPVRGKRFART